jgi:hypothetical protein
MLTDDYNPQCKICEDTGEVWVAEQYENGEYTRTVVAEPCECRPVIPTIEEQQRAIIQQLAEALENFTIRNEISGVGFIPAGSHEKALHALTAAKSYLGDTNGK